MTPRQRKLQRVRARNRRIQASRSASQELKAEAEYRKREIAARFDLADFGEEINEQFARARHESGNTPLNREELRRMIDRSRHEIFQANPWLKGTVRSNTVSVIGRGPEIEIKVEGREEDANAVEMLFNHWLKARKTGRKFRTMANAKQSDGTGLAQVQDNAKQKVHGISLDFQPFDRDHVKRPRDQFNLDQTEYLLDGKEFDPVTGEPSRYWITPKHPAEHPESEPQPVDAKFILDVWNNDRPSQGMGAPEYATTVKNGPLARSFRRATLDAATTAAKHTGIMKTSVDRFDNGDMNFQGMDNWVTIPTQYGMLTALPYGWDLEQMKAEHPTSTHEGFLRSLAAEHGRANNQPAYISTGDGLGLNMSSMHGLRQEWEQEVGVQRQEWETEALAKLFRLWLEEASSAEIGLVARDFADLLIGEELPTEVIKVSVTWRWSKRRHSDTNREYTGRKAAIETGAKSRTAWQQEDNINPEADDMAAAVGYGVPVDVYRRALFLNTFGDAARTALGLPTTSQGGAVNDPQDATEAEQVQDDQGGDPAEPDTAGGDGEA